MGCVFSNSRPPRVINAATYSEQATVVYRWVQLYEWTAVWQIPFCFSAGEFLCVDFPLHVSDDHLLCFFKCVTVGRPPTNVPATTVFIFLRMSKAVSNVLEVGHSICQ